MGTAGRRMLSTPFCRLRVGRGCELEDGAFEKTFGRTVYSRTVGLFRARLTRASAGGPSS